jgi:hypothetical protein
MWPQVSRRLRTPALRSEARIINQRAACGNYVYILMNNVESRTRMRLTDKFLEGCMRIASAEVNLDTTQVKAVSDLSLMTDFVKEN